MGKNWTEENRSKKEYQTTNKQQTGTTYTSVWKNNNGNVDNVQKNTDRNQKETQYYTHAHIQTTDSQTQEQNGKNGGIKN